MLFSLKIKNIVLIKDLHLQFKTGLSALTGETGAGKSILLDSLGLVLGARSDSGLVRHGEEEASVTAVFDLPDTHEVHVLLKEHSIDIDDSLIIKRILNQSGKSKAFVNDQSVTAKFLQKIGALLVEIHGQYDSQSLFDVRQHQEYLDRLINDPTIFSKLSKCWREWRESEKDYLKSKNSADHLKEEETFLRESIHDLDALNPKENEEKELNRIKNTLKKSDQIIESSQIADSNIEEMEGLTSNIWRAFERFEDMGHDVKTVLGRLDAEITELKDSVRSLAHDITNSDYSLEEVDDRLYALKAQAKKHNCDVDSLNDKREELAAQLNDIENFDSLISEKLKKIEISKQAYFKIAEKLSGLRKKNAKILEDLIHKELPSLKLENAKFSVSHNSLPEDNWTEQGMDKIEFLISTNPGSPLAPLNKVASGGEMSRFILGVKAVLSLNDSISTMVFDEVDSGVGGATAAAVGKRLSQLSDDKQILVVTHSPQVAAMADSHFHIEKYGNKEIITTVKELDESEREDEVARMLSGDEITKEARAAASKLLEKKAA